jgi:uncharacterized membrane protein YphA (DoxX/SURF4 family)
VLVSIIVGGAILIGSFLLFGPVGLVFALVGALLCGWFFSGNNMTDQQKQEHNDNIKETFYDLFGANKK